MTFVYGRKSKVKESVSNMKKEIVFLINNVYSDGGVARVTLLIIDNLIRTGKYNVTLVSFSRPAVHSVYKIPKKCKAINLPIRQFSIRKHSLKAARELQRLFPSDFDGTFVVDDVGHNIPAWIGLLHCKKARFISWTHTNFFNGSKYGFSGIGKRLAVRKFDYLITLTKEDQNYYKTILNAKNVVQIYNPKNPAVVKQDYNSEAKKIISCGQLVQPKGFDKLIDVAKKVFEHTHEWQWDIYGDGPEKANLLKKIAEYGLEGKVNLMGYHSDILNIYKDYSFYVFISTGEGCPMTMIEAQSAGLPMVSYDFKCGPRDLITDGENGFIVENWNMEKMTDRILQLINDKELRCRFAEHADMNLKELEMPYVIEKWLEIL